MTKFAFIWDLDGTLLDSYPIIAPSLRDACAEYGLDYPLDFVYEYVIRTSVTALIYHAAKESGADPAAVKERYSEISNSRNGQISAMKNALAILEKLRGANCGNFVFTHRGASSLSVLQQTGLDTFFTEVLTSQSGFPRKPDPAAIGYLLEKYALDPAHTFYVGDRNLDIETAINAGIRSILYLSPDSPGTSSGLEDYVITNLLDIWDVLKQEKNCDKSYNG